MLTNRGLCALIVVLVPTPPAVAQTVWGGAEWRIEARDHRFERHHGEDALRLHNGAAWLLDSELEDGTVSFDLFTSSGLGFHGLAFRASDDANYEHFYLRPFASGSPDATQYTPVSNGVSGWQIYADERFARAVPVPAERWIRIEVQFRDQEAHVTVDGKALSFPALQRPARPGMLALTSSGAAARFANVVIDSAAPALQAEDVAPAAEAPAEGLIREWSISTTFPESRLDSLRPLDPHWTDSLGWQPLGVHVRGVVDIARLRSRAEGNTVFAATTLRAAGPRTARLRFGFSDRAHVYLNGRPLFRGADGWRSRDHRFLGTVGLYDELVLSLATGDNALWIAVSEDFGGWGVTAQLVDHEGVEVVPRP